MRFKLFAILALFLVAGQLVEAKPKHAIVKLAQATVSAPAHPKRTLKATLGAVLFAVETGNDVVLGGLTGLDKAASMELKYNPFHPLAVLDGKIDGYIESAETFLFGSHN